MTTPPKGRVKRCGAALLHALLKSVEQRLQLASALGISVVGYGVEAAAGGA